MKDIVKMLATILLFSSMIRTCEHDITPKREEALIICTLCCVIVLIIVNWIEPYTTKK